MAAGILLMDLIWAAGLVGLTLLSTHASLACAAALASSSSAVQIAAGIVTALLTWIAACAVILFLIPRPLPGKHRLMRGASFYFWALGFIARRWIELPPMGLLWRQSGVLRFLVLRASGARVAFTAQMSSDATVLDPPLLSMGAGAMLGSQSTVAGHFILGDRLLLAPVVIAPGAQIAIDVIIGPGTTIGRNAVIEARSSIGPECVIGDGVHLAGGVGMGRGVVVGARARIPVASILPAGTIIPEGGTWPLSPSPEAPTAPTPDPKVTP